MIYYLSDIFITAIYVAVVVWYSRRVLSLEDRLREVLLEQKHGQAKLSAEWVERVHADLSRHYRRLHYLHACDFLYAQKYNKPIRGLAFVIPMSVLTRQAPVDVTMYFTTDEVEAIKYGYSIFAKDARTDDIRSHFILR